MFEIELNDISLKSSMALVSGFTEFVCYSLHRQMQDASAPMQADTYM